MSKSVELIIDTQPLVQALEILGVLTNCAGVQYAVGGIVHGGECDDDTWRKCRARLSRLVGIEFVSFNKPSQAPLDVLVETR